jgi:hypothetical protein
MHLLPKDFEVRNSSSGVNAEDKEKGFQYTYIPGIELVYET